MPYIDQPSRRKLDSGSDPSNPGELTYVLTLDTPNGRDAEHLTHVLVRYVESQGRCFQNVRRDPGEPGGHEAGAVPSPDGES